MHFFAGLGGREMGTKIVNSNVVNRLTFPNSVAGHLGLVFSDITYTQLFQQAEDDQAGENL